jgi:hypothetical protein
MVINLKKDTNVVLNFYVQCKHSNHVDLYLLVILELTKRLKFDVTVEIPTNFVQNLF